MTPTLTRLRIDAHGTVVSSQPGTDCQSHMAAWCCVLPSGRWLVSYRAARDKNNTLQRVMLTWSDDEGKSWSKPFTPFADRKVSGKFGQFRAMACTALGGQQLVAALWWVDASEPHKPFFNEKTEGIFDSYLFIARSEDGGVHWTEPQRVDAERFDKFPCPMTGPILVFPSGEWAAQFEPNRPYDDGTVAHHYMPAFIFSRDAGKTWGGAVQPQIDPQHVICYGDQRPSVLDDGTLIDFFWTFNTATGKFLNIHAASSRDSGRTWSPMWDTGVVTQPGPARSLPDGRIALVYVDRTGSPAIKLRVSDDGGRTFPAETELTLHQPGLASQSRDKQNIKEMWDELQKLYSIGLPHMEKLPNGDLLVVFYSGPKTDETDIRWVRVGTVS